MIFAFFCSETSLFSSEKIGKMSKIHFFINFVQGIFSKICHISFKIMFKKTCFWTQIPQKRYPSPCIPGRGLSCFSAVYQRYNFKCCFCCFCCVLGYHDVVFQKVQNLSLQKSTWSMGLFPSVKKLHHFEIPMGYC